MRHKALVSTLVSLIGVMAIGVVSAVTQSNDGLAMGRVPGGPVASAPTSRIHGGTPEDRTRIDVALQRFADAGLQLPPLRIVFPASADGCRGGFGHFTPSAEIWEIAICAESDWVHEHELAHAWELANLTDGQRREYTSFRGLPTWSDEAYDWRERGEEDAALVIQQGLAGVALAPILSGEAISRLEAFEMLTGRIAPRLVEWMAGREVPCGQRPTRSSRLVPDLSGLVCSRAGIEPMAPSRASGVPS